MNEDGKKVRIKYGDQDQLTIATGSETFPILKVWIETVLKQLKVEARQIKQLIIVADELCSNIVNYAYPGNEEDKTLTITIDFTYGENLFTITFSDHGGEFNPLETTANGLPTERIKQRIPGGLGLFLVRQFMDHMEYRRDGRFNVLTLSKKLNLEPDAVPCV